MIHRERGLDALPDLGILADDEGLAIWRNADIRIERGRSFRRAAFTLREGRNAEVQHQATSRRRRWR
ncbi:MAG: hypothetical protein WDO56_27680 [Gammaproteobacteria bacterium]